MQLTHSRLWSWCEVVSVRRIRVSAEVRRLLRVLLVWRGVGCLGLRGSPSTSAFVWGGSDLLKNDKKTFESQAQ